MESVIAHCARFVRHYGIVASLRELGPFIREVLFRTEERAELADGFDRAQGTDTSGMVMPWELSDARSAPAGSNPYASLTSARIRELLDKAPVRPGETVLVDLGSGKGRVLLVARDYPFKRIVGVEWSADLDRVARSNVAIAAARRGPESRIELRCQDAATYEFPPAPLVVFLFNPFGQATMRSVVGNLERTLAQSPRPVFVVYANPEHAALFERSPAFHRMSGDRSHALFESRVI